MDAVPRLLFACYPAKRVISRLPSKKGNSFCKLQPKLKESVAFSPRLATTSSALPGSGHTRDLYAAISISGDCFQSIYARRALTRKVLPVSSPPPPGRARAQNCSSLCSSPPPPGRARARMRRAGLLGVNCSSLRRSPPPPGWAQAQRRRAGLLGVNCSSLRRSPPQPGRAQAQRRRAGLLGVLHCAPRFAACRRHQAGPGYGGGLRDLAGGCELLLASPQPLAAASLPGYGCGGLGCWV